jgi:hypothetical protein
VERFNASMEACPDPGSRLQDITLLDDETTPTKQFQFDASKREMFDQEDTEWRCHWRILFTHLGKVTQKRRLSTLVMSLNVCTRLDKNFWWHSFNQDQMVKLTLNTSMFRLRVDHLVASHTSFDFLIKAFDAKKITWYGSRQVSCLAMLNPYTDYPCNLGSKLLIEVHFIIGDFTTKQHLVLIPEYYQCLLNASPWSPRLKSFLDSLRKIQKIEPTIYVHYHKGMQIGDNDTLRGYKIDVRTWGCVKDGHSAEINSWKLNGWVPRQFNSSLEKVPSVEKRKKKKDSKIRSIEEVD